MSNRFTSVASLLVLSAVALGVLPLVFYALRQGGGMQLDTYVWSVLRFTLLQAGLSTLLSVVPALAIALALHRQNFWGRDVLLALFAVPLSLPAISAVLGITALYGSNGAVGGWFNLYGLTGILLAHVFFNLPLATRIFLQGLSCIPAESIRLAAQLDLKGWKRFRNVEWPALSPYIGAVSVLVFLLCASSFVIVLTLGGGPQATTLEVAIYQSLRLDFDVTRAVSLGFVQLMLCGALVLLAQKFANVDAVSAPLRLANTFQPAQNPFSKFADVVLIALAAALVLPILSSVLFSGLLDFKLDTQLPQALLTSFALATVSGLLTTTLAYFLAKSKTPIHFAGLIVPPAVMATGWFIFFRGSANAIWLSAALIVALNVLMSLPFAVTLLAPARNRFDKAYSRLIRSLGLSPWRSFKQLEFTALQSTFVQSFLISFALSFGDLTAVALLGSNGLVTLPSLLSQQLGNYRQTAAATTALILALIACTASFSAQKLANKHA